MQKSRLLMLVAITCCLLGPFTSVVWCQQPEQHGSAKEEPNKSPSVTNETLSLLRALRDSGRTGTYILVVALIVVVGTATWMIFLQRQSLTKFNQLSQAHESQLKMIETTIKSQEFVQQGLVTQHSVVKQTNDELRAELQRIKQGQDSMKQSVKDTIDAGLQDISKRLEHISVSQILEQIPEKFRADVQKELMEASEQVSKHVREELQRLPSSQVAEEIQLAFRRSLDAHSPEFDMYTRRLADRIAHLLRESQGFPYR